MKEFQRQIDAALNTALAHLPKCSHDEEDRKMIQGLKVTVPGKVIADLLKKKAEYHHGKAKSYQQTYETLVAALGPVTKEDAPKMSSMHSDPRKEAQDGVQRHKTKAQEDEFLAQYVNQNEDFLLATEDLHRLGVLENRF